MPNSVKIGRYRVADRKDGNYIEIDGVRINGLKDFSVVDNGSTPPTLSITFVPEVLTIDNTLPPLPPDPVDPPEEEPAP